MECGMREWKLSDADDLAAALSNKNVLDNLSIFSADKIINSEVI